MSWFKSSRNREVGPSDPVAATAVMERPVLSAPDIEGHLSPRRPSVPTPIASDYDAQIAAYEATTLRAEENSLYQLKRKREAQIGRQRWVSVGRKIDLLNLLKQQRPTLEPRWAIVDPRLDISRSNGAVAPDGFYIGQGRGVVSGMFADSMPPQIPLKFHIRHLHPCAIPPLPPEVRELFTAEKHRELREATIWMGVLYQPEEWMEVKPDPAVVCEYRCMPGEYYCLMLWGGDKANIEEWVS